MRRLVLLVLSACCIGTSAPIAQAHGGAEATSHDMPGVIAPILHVSVKPEGAGYRLHIDAERFRWTGSPTIGTFVMGRGMARIFIDDVKVGRAYGPDVHVDPRLLGTPGPHTATVTLTGEDMVPYSSDGAEIETTVPLPEHAIDLAPDSLAVPADAELRLEAWNDPFGGILSSAVVSGLDPDVGADVDLELDGRPWTRSVATVAHVLPASLGDTRETHTIRAIARDRAGRTLERDGAPLAVTVELSSADEAPRTARAGGRPVAPWPLIIGIVLGIVAVAVAVTLARRRSRHRAASTA
jgi:hypothetical protein